MGRSKRTRSEIRRARQADSSRPHTVKAYGFAVDDPLAQRWESQVVFIAASPGEAERRREQLGLTEKRSRPLSDEELEAGRVYLASQGGGSAYLRRHHDKGWTRWYELPSTYSHPGRSEALSAAPELFLPGEPRDPRGEFGTAAQVGDI